MDDIRDRFRTPNNGGRRDFLGPMQPRPARSRPARPQGQQQKPPFMQKPKPAPKPAPKPQPRQQKPRQQQPAWSPAGPMQQPAPRTRSSKPGQSSRKKKRSKKPVIAVLLVLLLAAGGGGGYFYMGRSSGEQVSESQPTADIAGATTSDTEAAAEPEIPQGSIKLVATGTFAAYDSINQNAKTQNGYDYLPLMRGVKPAFDAADVGICHQETLAAGADKGVSGYPVFNAPFEWSQGMVDLGCNVFNMSSFNTNDKGQAAIAAALQFFDGKESVLATAGANNSKPQQNSIRYFEVKGVKFAMLAYTTSSQKPANPAYGVNMYSQDLVKKQAREARDNADFVIVGMTWGKPDDPTLTAQQKNIAKFLAAQDVDLVIGNGTHTVQPAEVLDGSEGHQTLVWYGLGNAVNSQLPIENLIGGIAMVEIDIATGNMINPGFLPVYQHYEWTAAQKASRDFDARKNFQLVMLDTAANLLKKSQNNTTVEAQTTRVKNIITKNAPIKMLKSKDFQ